MRLTSVALLALTPCAAKAPEARNKLARCGSAGTGGKNGPERRRCDTQPSINFGSKAIPCFFSKATNSASKPIFL